MRDDRSKRLAVARLRLRWARQGEGGVARGVGYGGVDMPVRDWRNWLLQITPETARETLTSHYQSAIFP